MARQKAFPRVAKFGANLPREVEKLERNVADKFRSDNESAFGPFKVSDLKTTTYTAQPWDFVRADASAGDVTIALPDAGAPNGGNIIVKDDGDSGNIIITCPVGNTINRSGGGFVVISTRGGTLIFVPNTVTKDWMVSGSGSSLGVQDVVAGAGLTGGGLGPVVTLDVVANADGSIVVNPDDIQVGVLATDAQHGVRGGGTQHSIVTTTVAGFMSAAMLVALNSLVAGSVPSTRQVIAGAGLTGGGDLSADRTFNVVAADGTITVNAHSIQVGQITNTNVSTSAAIAVSKLANGSQGQALISGASVPAWGSDFSPQNLVTSGTFSLNSSTPTLRLGLAPGSGSTVQSAANTGSIRGARGALGTGLTIYGRNDADTGDVQLFAWDSVTPLVRLGSATSGSTFINLGATGRLGINSGTPVLDWSSVSLTASVTTIQGPASGAFWGGPQVSTSGATNGTNTFRGADVTGAGTTITAGATVYQAGSVTAIATATNGVAGNALFAAGDVLVGLAGTNTAGITTVRGGNVVIGTGGDLRLLGGTGSVAAGVVALDVASPILRLGLKAGSGAGSASSSGTIRGPDGFTLVARNSTDTGNIGIIAESSTGTFFGDRGNSTPYISMLVAGTMQLFGSGLALALSLNAGQITANANLIVMGATGGEITGTVVSTAGGNGGTLQVSGGSTSDNTQTVAGGLATFNGGDIATGGAAGFTFTGGNGLFRGGDSIVNSGGTHVGGDFIGRPGHGATTDGTLRLQDGTSTDQLTVTAGVVSIPNVLSMGATPSTVGQIRTKNVFQTAFRNAANTANRNVWSTNGSDALTIGDSLCLPTTVTGNSLILQALASSINMNATGGFMNLIGFSTALGGGGISFDPTNTAMNLIHTNQTAGGALVAGNTTISAQGCASGTFTNGNGGSLLLVPGRQSISPFVAGSVRLKTSDLGSGLSATVIEAASVKYGTRQTALNVGADLTTTMMPTNTGDLVTFIGNAASTPTASAVGGGILYATGGALRWRGSAGTDTLVATA